ncbi:MAG TPA: L,D-transpeptidase family protein [Chthoniobacterales bacterium]|nr:L,D-transpeptidase family protein [Chthoniobacterales bacterium]
MNHAPPATPAELKTIQDRLAEFGGPVRKRLAPHFAQAGVHYPPSRLAFVAIKETQKLEVWAANEGEELRFIREYDVLAASGRLGPKLREGDRQVPEGAYRIVLLNPNSRYHLSLRVSYPNEFDLAQAGREGRTEPGTDIMIHGGARSRGCLAVGDEGAEDMFVVAALTETREIPLLISPVDFRVREFAAPADAPTWTEELYREIRAKLAAFQRPPAIETVDVD